MTDPKKAGDDLAESIGSDALRWWNFHPAAAESEVEDAEPTLPDQPIPEPPAPEAPLPEPRAPGDYILGIDISHYQKASLFDVVKLHEDKIEYVIVNVCDGTVEDKAYKEHVAWIRDGGFKLGAYQFYRQPQARQDQFDTYRRLLDAVGYGPGDLAPALDLEPWMTEPVDKNKFNTDARWLLEQLADHYGTALNYTFPGFFQLLGSPSWFADFPLWLSHFTAKVEPMKPKGIPEWDIWQHRGGTFKNKEGKVTLMGGRLQGYANGTLDIDLNRARRLPTIV